MKKLLIAVMVVQLLSCKEESKQAATNTSFSTDNKKIVVYTTADSTNYRLTVTDTLSFKDMGQPFETQLCVFVDPVRTYQTYLGVGAALTDASAETYAKLSKEKQQEFMQAYFDKTKGIGYTLARTNIHSCDFSSGSYTYVTEGDKELTSFNIEHDKKFRIPFIKIFLRIGWFPITTKGKVD